MQVRAGRGGARPGTLPEDAEMENNEFLCCPKCKAELESAGKAGTGGQAADVACLACAECGARYSVAEAVPDFVGDRNIDVRLAQKLMQSRRMVSIYESRWWRGSRIFSRFMGITLEDEIALIRKIDAAGPDDAILDLACGPGIFARAFAEESPARRVFGLDLSWPMLRYAVRKAGKLGLANITFLRGDAHELPFRDGSLDVANCCGALHLFSDVRRVLGELHRVLKPGGRLSVAAALVRPSSAFSRLKAYLDGRFWKIHYFRKEEMKGLLDEAGFAPTIHHARGIWMIAGGVRRA